MKHNLPFKLCFLFSMLFSLTSKAQTGPLVLADYDNVNLDFTGFGNSQYYKVKNPSKTGINTTEWVAQTTKGTEIWAGIVNSDSLPTKLDFTTNTVFNLKVYSPLQCKVTIELQDWKNSNIKKRVVVPVTKINEWQNLLFDFAGTENKTYNKIVIFFDEGSDKVNTFYFDDLKLGEYVLGVTAPKITNAGPVNQSPKPGEIITLTATITDDIAILGAVVNWGTASSNLSNSLTMTNNAGTFSANIPGQADGASVYYQITAADGNGNSTSTPVSGIIVSNKESIVFADYDVVDLSFKGYYESQFYELDNIKKDNVNSSNRVGQLTRGYNTWEGIGSVQLAKKIDFSVNKYFTMKVFSHKKTAAVIHLEDFKDNTITYEVSVQIPDTGKWVQLTFDFSAALSNTFDKINIVMDPGTHDLSTYYFDDIELAASIPTGIKEISKNNISAFPNPFKDQISIVSNDNEGEVAVYDLTGRNVLNNSLKNGNNVISTTDLSSGIYMVYIKTNNSVARQKLVKE